MATCKECVRNNICNIKQKYNHPKYMLQHIEKYCEYFKDSSRFVELPDKHGILVDVNEVKEKLIQYGFTAPDMTVTEFVEDELTTVVEAE